MSSSAYEKTFDISIPVVDGAIIAQVSDADRINFLSFQLVGMLSGVTPNITFTLLARNDKKAPWIETTITQNFAAAGAINKLLEIDWAKAAAYALKVTITAGVIDALKVYVVGKG